MSTHENKIFDNWTFHIVGVMKRVGGKSFLEWIFQRNGAGWRICHLGVVWRQRKWNNGEGYLWHWKMEGDKGRREIENHCDRKTNCSKLYAILPKDSEMD